MSETNRDRLLLLPDDQALPEADDGLGLVAMPGGLAALKQVGEAMRAVPESAPAKEEASADAEHTALWRGLTALALLCDTWEDGPVLRTVPVTAGTSGFARAALRAAGEEELHLAVLGRGSDSRVLGVCDAFSFLKPAAAREDLGSLLPERVTWYNREQRTFSDPCEVLCDRDRRILADRLALANSAQAVAFRRDLLEKDANLSGACVSGERSEDWETAVKAVVGLAPELTDDLFTVRELRYREHSAGNALLAQVGLRPNDQGGWLPQLQWSWRGVPFAVSSIRCGVMPLRGFTFTHLRRECMLLEENSRRYAGDLAGRLESYAAARPEGLLEAARERLLLWAANARAAAHRPEETLELNWPWESGSPAISILLDEALGVSLRAAGMRPFADKLFLMHGGMLGHNALQQRCAMFFGTDVYTALPPISDTVAEFMARFGWTGRGLDVDSLTLAADDEGVLVSMVLHGTGRVCVKKRYEGDDIIVAEENDVPQVSLWPAVPLDRSCWSLYYLSCRGDLELHYLADGEWVALPQPEAPAAPEAAAPDAPVIEPAADAPASEEPPAETAQPEPQPEPIRPLDPCRVVRSDVMPSCVSVHRGGLCLGALLCTASPCHPQDKGAAVISLDAGTSGIAMAMLLNGAVQPVSVPSLWHVMVCGAREDLPGEALPVWQAGPVMPSCIQLVPGTDGAEPMLDGHICLEPALDALLERGTDPVYDILSRTDAEAVRARTLLWRESMLLSAFHAVMCGASSITWRAVLPDDALPDDRRRLLEEVRRTSGWLASACPVQQNTVQDPYGMRGLLVTALELRDSGTLRGAFMLMDVGASSTGMALWLRGMNRPALEFSAGRGVPGMLMDELLRRPGMLREDFKALRLPDNRLAAREGMTQAAWSADRLLLDSLLGTHLPEASGLMNNLARAGAMTRTQALLLLGFAELMTLAGMALEQVGMNSLLNDYLPPEMALAIGGRGAQVLASIDPALRGPLTSFVRTAMSPDHRVRTLRLTAAGDARLTPVFGLCRLRTLPEKPVTASTAFTADRQPLLQITARFLAQLRMNWPVLCSLLFPGLFTPEGSFTQEGQSLVTQIVNDTDGTVQARFSDAIARIRIACAAAEGDDRA